MPLQNLHVLALSYLYAWHDYRREGGADNAARVENTSEAWKAAGCPVEDTGGGPALPLPDLDPRPFGQFRGTSTGQDDVVPAPDDDSLFIGVDHGVQPSASTFVVVAFGPYLFVLEGDWSMTEVDGMELRAASADSAGPEAV